MFNQLLLLFLNYARYKRGAAYAYYAVFAIFREIANGNYSTIVSGQVEGAYVDDLLISDGTTNVYHQLKNKKNPSWGEYGTW